MAQVNILNLPVRINLTGDEYVPGQAVGETTQRFTTAQIAALAPSAFSDVVIVTSIIAMKVLHPNSTSLCFLDDEGRSGTFFFIADDFTAQVTADPANGVYVAPDTDPTGASGAWVRNYSGGTNLLWFGAVGDGATDNSIAWAAAVAYCNTQYSAAVSTGFPISTAALYIPSGDWRIDTGASVATGNLIIFGAGRENTRILIGSGQYLLTITGSLYQFDFRGVSTSGGLGIIAQTYTGANVLGEYTVEDCNFNNYTQCAIGTLSSDMPYWCIRRNLFYGTSALTSKGVVLGGAADVSFIEENSFSLNRYHIKLVGGGSNIKVRDNDLIRFIDGGGSPQLTDIWIVPNASSANAGPGFEATGNKFGNENMNAADYRVLVADEGSGTNSFDKNHSTSASTGYWIGAKIASVVFGVASPTYGFIYSYTKNLRSLQVKNYWDSKYPYVVQYDAGLTFSTDDRTLQASVFDLSSITDGGESYTGPISTQQGIGLVDDPFGYLNGQLGSLKAQTCGFDVSLVNCLTSNDITAAGTASASLTNITDAVGGTNAVTVRYSSGSGTIWLDATTGNFTVNRLAWIEIDVKVAGAQPLTKVGIQLRTDAFGIAAKRILNIPSYWSTVRIPFYPAQTGTQLRLHVTPGDYSAGVATDVRLGRPRIYQGSEPTWASDVPVTAGEFIPTSSVVPVNGLYLPAANTLGLAVNSTAEVQLTSTALSPAVSDGNALGSASLAWGDLFLASGGVINWNNGNYTLTHSAGLLTANGRLAITQGTANTSVLTSTGYSLTGTSAANMIDLAGTWNTSGAPTAIKLNITNTASDAASKLMDLQVGGASRLSLFPVSPGLVVRLNNGTIPTLGAEIAGVFAASSGSNWTAICIVGGPAGTSRLYFGDDDSASSGAIVYDHVANGLSFYTNGSATVALSSAGALTPVSSDGAALGTASLMWSDLFLASGGVINFNNGNLTLTHSAGLLTNSAAFTTTDLTVTNTLRINVAPSAIGTGVKTISNAADGSTNFGHYAAINLNGTVYFFPCSSVAPT